MDRARNDRKPIFIEKSLQGASAQHAVSRALNLMDMGRYVDVSKAVSGGSQVYVICERRGGRIPAGTPAAAPAAAPVSGPRSGKYARTSRNL